ncbi:MAG TPA: hypothetical protein K8W18_06775, partial [Corynebacterium glutamicum]|nr:hypothetical protein [Corynebacterium glutamicum]
ATVGRVAPQELPREESKKLCHKIWKPRFLPEENSQAADKVQSAMMRRNFPCRGKPIMGQNPFSPK